MKIGLTWRMNSLMALWGVMILMGGTVTFAAEKCPKDNYRVTMNGHSLCCQPCEQSEESLACQNSNQLLQECRCSQGFGCNSKSCNSCVKLPDCKKKSQLRRSEKESTVYEYYCEESSPRTPSNEENGIHKPGEEKISITESSRNDSSMSSTQKVESKPSTPRIKGNTGTVFNNWTSLALYLALAVFIILLITVTIHLLIWKMKAAQILKIAGDQFPPHIIINKNAKEDTDSWSCQYPEEEHGEEHGNGLVHKLEV
ncbi:tumor necrosis factor receptor superfamily member 18 [Phyllobates terribilis]|uniref:tumor necrosis factor receptor superfamily member 18 n=1 Tax=Phyllobates terribilis TaxID=111132 RepID=UPI003CCB0374